MSNLCKHGRPEIPIFFYVVFISYKIGVKYKEYATKVNGREEEVLGTYWSGQNHPRLADIQGSIQQDSDALGITAQQCSVWLKRGSVTLEASHEE